jgi:hypothetical protein
VSAWEKPSVDLHNMPGGSHTGLQFFIASRNVFLISDQKPLLKNGFPMANFLFN